MNALLVYCLHCCDNFSSTLIKCNTNLYLLEQLQFQMSRYAATNKALRLIKNHSALFQKIIGLNSKTTYDILFHCHSISKETLKKHMDDALYAVVAEIARYVVINSSLLQQGSSDASDTLNKKKKKAKDSGILEIIISLSHLFLFIGTLLICDVSFSSL